MWKYIVTVVCVMLRDVIFGSQLSAVLLFLYTVCMYVEWVYVSIQIGAQVDRYKCVKSGQHTCITCR